ncbi:SCO family protein [Metapseudomonas boanensis]|uniref:SCO family protein n=1 Tax=Metapseudomonas boanensis TaxID=2822138 RepID=A0ABS5XEF1_9GAMM|nr:SCO family protein [Pseudomonas boanensis]MBT8766060.1 SCO family protein [Pseudomonas boanensis]
MNTRRDLLAGAGLIGAATLGWAAWRGVGEATKHNRDTTTSRSRLPNPPLLTHEGKTVRFYDYLIRGKVVAINMMYTSCTGTCPTATANLLQVQKMLGKRIGRDVFMYSITLQPELDTPQALKDYAERNKVAPGWLFLTGSPADIEQLRRSLGFYDPDPQVDGDKATHSGMLRIGNDAFDRWTMAPALGAPEQILATIDHVDEDVPRGA